MSWSRCPSVARRGMRSVTTDREDAATIGAFESPLAEIPTVCRAAERLFGEPDYPIRLATADTAAYQRLRDDVLAPSLAMSFLDLTRGALSRRSTAWR